MADSYMEDVESVKVSMMRQQQAVVEKLEREYGNKVVALNSKVCFKNQFFCKNFLSLSVYHFYHL